MNGHQHMCVFPLGVCTWWHNALLDEAFISVICFIKWKWDSLKRYFIHHKKDNFTLIADEGVVNKVHTHTLCRGMMVMIMMTMTTSASTHQATMHQGYSIRNWVCFSKKPYLWKNLKTSLPISQLSPSVCHMIPVNLTNYLHINLPICSHSLYLAGALQKQSDNIYKMSLNFPDAST